MWALVVGGVVRELTDADPAKRFHPSLTWVAAPANAVPGWLCDGTNFTAPPVGPTAAELAAQARAALAASDIVVLRCVENHVPVPDSWREYRGSLRSLVAGTSAATALPDRPGWPAGT